MKKNSKLDQDTLFIKLLFKSSAKVTEDEIEYTPTLARVTDIKYTK